MPLVWEFTSTVRSNVLRRLDTKLFDFRADPAFRDVFALLLSNPALHYEQMVGELETLHMQNGPRSEIARVTVLQLIECLQLLLLEEQSNTTKLFAEKVKDYSGLKHLLDRQSTLDIFSLNHDLNVEEMCRFHNVPCRDGFFEEPASRYAHITRFKTLTKKVMDAGAMNFFDTKDYGVNLLKLHGSLDMFAVEDKNLYLKCQPEENEPLGGHVLGVTRIEKHSLAVCARFQTRGVNELLVQDSLGELQFLRRSLLSGAHKFAGRFEQIAPIALFDEFKRRVARITELDVIGYGFGDSHINEVLRTWLGGFDVTLNIYDPYRQSAPASFENTKGKVIIHNLGLTDYLSRFAPLSKRSVVDRVRHMFLNKVREDLRQKRLSAFKPEPPAS